MAERSRVAPTAIQRNKLDVATELTQLYFQDRLVENIEAVEQAFTRFYALVRVLDDMHSEDLAALVPDSLDLPYRR